MYPFPYIFDSWIQVIPYEEIHAIDVYAEETSQYSDNNHGEHPLKSV